MRRRVAALGLAALLAACAASPEDGAIHVSNDSGISVAIAVNRTSVGTVEPGFQGVLTAAGAGDTPRIVEITTLAGTRLFEWSAVGDASVSSFVFGECGEITLWRGPSGPSLPSAASASFSDCPD